MTNLNDSKFYIGLAGASFKEPYRNHTIDFEIKKKKIECTIQWKVLSHVEGLTKKMFVVFV